MNLISALFWTEIKRFRGFKALESEHSNPMTMKK